MQHLDTLTQRLPASASLHDLNGPRREECARLGFHAFVYGLSVPMHFAEVLIIMLDGCPEGWVKRYFEAAHFDADPMMAIA